MIALIRSCDLQTPWLCFTRTAYLKGLPSVQVKCAFDILPIIGFNNYLGVYAHRATILDVFDFQSLIHIIRKLVINSQFFPALISLPNALLVESRSKGPTSADIPFLPYER